MTSQTALTSTDLATRVTPDQLTLIRDTIAKDATPDELKLYLFDCQRQGVHPLDKLIHFTKRSGRYTPITSIDFMRIRAAATGECAGIDDAVFTGTPKTNDFSATVTVWRLVQGQRCAFTASARWSEYKPAANDFMWLKMPHVMLNKVAEACALRRGFPMQLHGLYEQSEMDQAVDQRSDSGTAITTPPTSTVSDDSQVAITGQTDTPAPLRTITPAQQRRLFTISRKAGWDKETMRRALLAKFAVRSTATITRDEYDVIVAHFSQAPTVIKIEDVPAADQPF